MASGWHPGLAPLRVTPAWDRRAGADRQISASLRHTAPPIAVSGSDWAGLEEQIRRCLLMRLLQDTGTRRPARQPPASVTG